MITMNLLIRSIRPLKHFNPKSVLHIGLPNDPLKDWEEKHSLFSMYRIYSNKRRPDKRRTWSGKVNQSAALE